MAAKCKGHTLKRDIAGDGFLNYVATRSLFPEKYDPCYYRVLQDLGFLELPGDKKLLAWNVAITMVQIYETLDKSRVFNDEDRSHHLERLQELPRLQKTLISFVSALNGKRQPEEPQQPQETEDLQEQLSRLMGEDDASSN